VIKTLIVPKKARLQNVTSGATPENKKPPASEDFRIRVAEKEG